MMVVLFLMASSVYAVPVTITYTADNIADTWYVQDDMDSPQNLDAGTNRSDWTLADTLKLDLEANSHYSFIWSVTNDGAFSDTNPAGFLAQIDLGEDLVLSSTDWRYSTDGYNSSDFDSSDWNWLNVSEYGNNGGNNIWGNNLGVPVDGISTDAQWIWSDDNFSNGIDQRLYVRADIKTAPVPEPATLLLLGSGLVGLAFIKRRKK